MGKTYKTQPDEHFIENISNYDVNELELDDEIDSLLLDSTAKRHKRSRRDRAANQRSQGMQKLPSDWFDSDSFNSGSRHHWR